MCGIAGTTLGYDSFKSIFDRVKHRGPDSEIYHCGMGGGFNVGLARLSITGEDKAAWIPRAKNDSWVVFNGEIFGYPKEEFSCDTAYLFDFLIKKRGIWAFANEPDHLGGGKASFTSKVRGQFAFACYDAVAQTLVLGRDFYGERPLYYCIDGENISFASEVRALLPVVKNRAVDMGPSYLFDFLETGVYRLSDNPSMVEGINAVPPNTLVFLEKKLGKWTKSFEDKLFPEYIHTNLLGNYKISNPVDYIGDALCRAAQERSEHGNHDVGLYLSGGLDSALLACLIRPKHVFTCACDTEIGRKEVMLAKMVADRIGATHHIVTPEITKEAVAKAIYYMDGPQGTASPVGAFALAAEASKFVKVVITGQGADELFCGYFRDLLFYTDYLLYNKYPKYAPMMDTFFGREDHLILNAKYPDVMAMKFLSLINRGEPGVLPLPLIEQAKTILRASNSPLDFASRMEFCFTLPSLVQMDDRAAAHVGIESRSPFLDEDVYKAAMLLPDEWRISFNERGFVTKRVLREIAKGLVPKDIIEDIEKSGLHIPVIQLFGTGRGQYDRSAYAKYSLEVWKDIVENGKTY